MIIAIDGPAGAGKSTVARLLAARRGAGYLDTGAMYRAIALLADEQGIASDNAAALTDLAERHPVTLTPGVDGNRVAIDGRDVTDLIRSSTISALVSPVSVHAGVRRACVAAQRALLAHGDWVCDGRDIGTVVWPQAELKVFLVADPDERARRRHADLAARGHQQPLDEVRADLRERDERDATRDQAPLRAAPDAVEVDTTALTIDEVVDALAGLARQRDGVRA